MVETPKEKVYIRQRRGKDIWEGLYEFILYETTDVVWPAKVLQSDFARQLFDGQALTARYISRIYRQELSHQRLQGQFITVRLSNLPSNKLKDYQLVPKSKLATTPSRNSSTPGSMDPSPAQSLFSEKR